MKKIFYLMLVALTMGMFTACDDNDENTPQINNPEPKEQWGKTLRGDNQTLLAFPDIYADYWEYTYSYKDNPNIGLRLTGKYPKSRFFNFTVYNDETQIDVSSIEGRKYPTRRQLYQPLRKGDRRLRIKWLYDLYHSS